MPTKIRLQQHGVRNHPYWWIIVQGPNRNANGRLIEHMGFWIPRKCSTVERAIVLNRPRLKYWLGTGAEPSAGVWKLLQFANFLPKRPPTFGSATLYERPVKPIPIQEDPLVKRLGAFKNRVDEVRRTEEEIRLARELYEKNAVRWASYSQKPTGEMTVDNLSKTSGKRDIEKVFEQYAKLMGSFDRIAPNASNEDRFNMLASVMEEQDEDEISTVMNKEGLMKTLKISEDKADELESVYWAVRQSITESDMIDIQEDMKFKGKKTLSEGKVYIPSPNTITPVPNFEQDELNEIPQQLNSFRNSLRHEKEFPGNIVVPRKHPRFKMLGKHDDGSVHR